MAPLLDSRESQYWLLYGLVDVSSQTKEKGANSLLFGQLYKRKYMPIHEKDANRLSKTNHY